MPNHEEDSHLLAQCLELFEYVTYHDGRYGQEMNRDFQGAACKLVDKLAQRLNRTPYEEYHK